MPPTRPSTSRPSSHPLKPGQPTSSKIKATFTSFLAWPTSSPPQARSRPTPRPFRPCRLPHVQQEQGHTTYSFFLAWSTSPPHLARSRPTSLSLVDFLLSSKNKAMPPTRPSTSRPSSHPLKHCQPTSSKNKATFTSFLAWPTSSPPQARSRPTSLSLVDFLLSSKNKAMPPTRPSTSHFTDPDLLNFLAVSKKIRNLKQFFFL